MAEGEGIVCDDSQFFRLCPAKIGDTIKQGWWRWEEHDELNFGHITCEVFLWHPGVTMTSKERYFAKKIMLATCSPFLI